MNDDLIVMLTAFNTEYEAVLARLTGVEQHWHDKGTLFEIGTVKGTSCRIALGLTGKGNQAAATLAERAIEHFSPAALVFVGVAGALWDTPLGDVVVATHVQAYHGGISEDDGLKARPRVWEIAHDVSQVSQYVARTREWECDVAPGTQVHFGVIAAGEVVHNSRLSAEARWIRQHYNDAMAIEMEAAGVAQAAHFSGCPIAIIRGISDLADGAKNSTADRNWQPVAASHAAAFAVRLAEQLIRKGEYWTMNDRTTGHRGSVHNYAAGQVGIQAVNAIGNMVYQNASGPIGGARDLAAELAIVRADIERERARGQVDDATYGAACAELDHADEALAADSPERKAKVVLALKRLGGLVSDLAGLAAKVTALIAAAKALA